MREPVLVVVFLRGGCDGLSLVAPSGDRDYIAARPGSLRVEGKGDDSGYRLDNAIADVDFRFHPRAKGLAELYKAGVLGVVHATGLVDGTRSHFEAEDRMERGMASSLGATDTGWLGRWYAATRPEGILPVLAVGSAAPDSLIGVDGVAVAQELDGLRVAPGHGYRKDILTRLGNGLGTHPLFGQPMRQLLKLSREIEARAALDEDGNLKAYAPLSGVEYPDDELGKNLRTVAQALKMDLGLRVATVDYGGWDTHIDQADAFAKQVDGLSNALSAFWRDLGSLQSEVVVTVMSEFGRRLRSNTSGGTDHGHGNVMFALGAGIRGGRMYGRWPGLDNEALDMGADLAITTDYRLVLSEIARVHLRFSDTGLLFPGLAASPVGLAV